MGGAEEGNSVVTPCGLHSGLRQQGAHPSRKKPRDGWGTRLFILSLAAPIILSGVSRVD